jgi:hypothetical protein
VSFLDGLEHHKDAHSNCTEVACGEQSRRYFAMDEFELILVNQSKCQMQAPSLHQFA